MEDLHLYDTYIKKYIKKDIDENELKELLKWVKSSNQNKEYFTCKINLIDENEKDENILTPHEIEQELARIKKLFKKTKKLRTYSNIQKIAAVLFIPLVLFCLYDKVIDKQNSNSQQASIIMKEFSTPKGVRANIVLPDSSRVWLNSCSKITFPEKFIGNKRNVKLIGEALFNVKKDNKKEFIVSASDIKIKVYGTSFNVNSYSDLPNIETTLVSGSVSILSNKKEKKIIPGQNASYNIKDKKLVIKEVDTKRYTAWKNGIIIFRHTPMKNVIHTLERWFNVQIEIKDSDIFNYTFTAHLEDKTIEQILKLLSKSSPIGYKIKNKNITIFKI